MCSAGWQRLEQQLPFVGRTAERGDDLGSRLLSARLAEDLMSLGFTLSRRWAPYGKWRGTVFRTVPVAASLSGLLAAAATSQGWREREAPWPRRPKRCSACSGTAACPPRTPRRSRSGTGPTAPSTWLPASLLADIADAEVARLPPGIGSIKQWADSVDVLASPGRRSALQAAYLAWIGSS